MQNLTPTFPGLHLQTLRRRPRTAQQKLTDELSILKRKSFTQLGEAFGDFIPSALLAPSKSGAHSRRRLLSKGNTFWAFLSQVLSDDGSCQEVVQKLKAYAALRGLRPPSSATAAYCKARSKLNMSELQAIHSHVMKASEDMGSNDNWYGHRVVVVDSTGVSMPDTEANQDQWPQQRHQKLGCGFPSARMTACFSLQTGTLLSYRVSNKHVSEVIRLRQQMETFNKGDIMLADKAFCGYMDIHQRLTRGVESVISLSRRRPVEEVAAEKKLGKNDLLVRWKRPVKLKGMSAADLRKLSNSMLLRQIKITVNQPGFRSESIYLVTTLLDAKRYPAEALAELYFRRWDVELFFRDIKTTLGMDILRCKTPQMIHKEILMHFITYNCVRRIMYEAAEEAEIPVRRVSFKTSLQTLRSWEPNLNQAKISPKERFRLISLLYDSITQKPLLQRPGRSEPRAVKRRPKNYQLMTKPRHEIFVPSHRNHNWLNKGKTCLS